MSGLSLTGRRQGAGDSRRGNLRSAYCSLNKQLMSSQKLLKINCVVENDIYIYRVCPARERRQWMPVLLFIFPDLQGRKHPVRDCTSAGGCVRGASSSLSTPRWSRHASVQLSRPKSSSSYDDAVVFDLQGRVPASGYTSNQYNHDMVQSAFSDELPPCTNSSTVLAAAALS